MCIMSPNHTKHVHLLFFNSLSTELRVRPNRYQSLPNWHWANWFSGETTAFQIREILQLPLKISLPFLAEVVRYNFVCLAEVLTRCTIVPLTALLSTVSPPFAISSWLLLYLLILSFCHFLTRSSCRHNIDSAIVCRKKFYFLK